MKKVRLTEYDDYHDISYWCYELDQLPNERDYFDYGDDKGYVIQVVEDEIKEKNYKKYTLYYEKNLDDWNNQVIEVAEVCSICIRV